MAAILVEELGAHYARTITLLHQRHSLFARQLRLGTCLPRHWHRLGLELWLAAHSPTIPSATPLAHSRAQASPISPGVVKSARIAPSPHAP